MGTKIRIEENLKLIDKLLAEGKEYLNRKDAVQASEKLYKVVEECIKLLAEKEELPEREEFKKELSRAARTLARKLEEEKLEEAWTRAFTFGASMKRLWTSSILNRMLLTWNGL